LIVFYFEHLLNTALGAIDGTRVIPTITNMAFAILLIGFLVGLYQAALRGGDLQALAVTAIKYIVVAMILSNWTTVFRDVNGSFTAVADFVSNSSGAGDMFMNWMTQLQQQATTNPNLTFWDMITGDISGTITVGLLLIAYIVYALAIIIFCFFYTLYGTVLYVTGPLVFRLPAFALMDDGYLFLKDGKVLSGSDWIPEHSAIVPLASKSGLCVRYPIRMVDDLLPFTNLHDPLIVKHLSEHVASQGCALTQAEGGDLMARQLRLEGAYVLHSETAKKNGGDFDFDWICVVEEDRFSRFVKHRLSRGLGAQQGKNKANKARDPWFNLEHVAMKARGNHIGSITDLMTSCRASGKEELAQQLAKELQNALDSLKWQVQPDLKLVSEIRQQVRQAPWLLCKNERRVGTAKALPLAVGHVESESEKLEPGSSVQGVVAVRQDLKEPAVLQLVFDSGIKATFVM
jgi:hypothetical protein